MHENQILLINLHPEISELSTWNALIRVKKILWGKGTIKSYQMKNINIGEKGVGDQCQQETFNDFPFQAIDLRSLI